MFVTLKKNDAYVYVFFTSLDDVSFAMWKTFLVYEANRKLLGYYTLQNLL